MIALTLLAYDADALDFTFDAKRCGVSRTTPVDIGNNPNIKLDSFIERGKLTSAESTPLPGMWDNLMYSCYGYRYIVHYHVGTGTYSYRYAVGTCHFKDKMGDSIIGSVTSESNNVVFEFKNGTGSWRGVTGTGMGHGEMPFPREGPPDQCSPINIKINVP